MVRLHLPVSCLDYGRSAAAPKMKADTSTLPQTRYPSKSSKTPRRTYEAGLYPS